MLKVTESTDSGGRPIVIVRRDGRVVASASVRLVEWMHASVPDHQLSPTQAALVQWYATKRLTVDPTTA